MEDAAIVSLYWQRDEAAIQETKTKYGAYLGKVAGIFWETRRTVRKASATPICGPGNPCRPSAPPFCPPTWQS